MHRVSTNIHIRVFTNTHIAYRINAVHYVVTNTHIVHRRDAMHRVSSNPKSEIPNPKSDWVMIALQDQLFADLPRLDVTAPVGFRSLRRQLV